MPKDKVKDLLAGKIVVFDENLIVRVTRSKATAGGIVLPESEKRSKIGVIAEVIACGEGRLQDGIGRVEMPVVPGDRIVISGQSGIPLSDTIITEVGISTSEATDVFLIRHQDIIAKITA